MVKIKSIQTKIISVVVVSVLFIATTLTILSVISINILNKRDSNQLLEHIGRENAMGINQMLINTEHSVKNIYYYAYDQLESLFGRLYSPSFRKDYMEKVSQLALNEAKSNDSVRVLYYRLTDTIKYASFDKTRDKNFGDVFNRADKAMYENKKFLKSKYDFQEN